MNVSLIRIVKEETEDSYSPSGSAFLKVNDKTVEVIVHPSGELDFEGYEIVNDEEFEAVMSFFNTNKKIQEAFPAEAYD